MKLTDEVIKNFVDALYPAHAAPEDRQVLHEALTELVKLAKAEKMLELRLDVNRGIGEVKNGASGDTP
jgi:hypothetical protein